MVYPKIMRVYRINSRAKVNLNLNVIKKSKIKKLHLIESLVCFVNLSDKSYQKKKDVLKLLILNRLKRWQGLKK